MATVVLFLYMNAKVVTKLLIIRVETHHYDRSCMNVEISQIVSLVLHANAYLQGHKISFDLNHSLAQICHSIEFITMPEVTSFENHSIIASSPNEWFTLLKAQSVERLNLLYASRNQHGLSDRIEVAFAGGGGRWVIEAVKGNVCDLWESIWNTGKMRGNRLWKVYYYLLSRDWPAQSESIPLSKARSRIQNALDDIISFAQKNEITEYWVEDFCAAKHALDAELIMAESDYVPNDFLSSEAKQLFNACFRGWVFGGMGSWNDYWFEDEDEQSEYNQVSDELYEAICLSLVSVANSS